MTPRIWFISGAASGIGQELACSALGRRDRVALLALDTGPLGGIAAAHPDRVIVLAADVRDEAAVRTAVETTIAKFGRIDVVANVFGAPNVLRATLPVLRDQRSGHVLHGSASTEAIAAELRPAGVKVTLVQLGEPGSASDPVRVVERIFAAVDAGTPPPMLALGRSAA